ncbi:MAG: RNA polymerase sigma factor [Solirubrobacteraceae bacterium]
MATSDPSDASLLASGRPSDFGAFYDRHVAAVTAYVGRRVRKADVIFDLVAETFARALENRSRYAAERGPAIAWLLGIARNLIMDSFRRGQVEAAGRIRMGMTPVELEDEQLESISRRGQIDLREALATLPAEQREGVIRRVLLDESYSEMARELRCSEQVVRKRVSRGLAALRANMETKR